MSRDVNKYISYSLWKLGNGDPFSEHSYLRNWSLVVPVCMKELAITVAVWHTEFRTASWSDGEKYVQKAQEEAATANSPYTICISSEHENNILVF